MPDDNYPARTHARAICRSTMAARITADGYACHATGGPAGHGGPADGARLAQPAVCRTWLATGRIRRAGDLAPLGRALQPDADGPVRSGHAVLGRHDQPHRPAGSGRPDRTPEAPDGPARRAGGPDTPGSGID